MSGFRNLGLGIRADGSIETVHSTLATEGFSKVYRVARGADHLSRIWSGAMRLLFPALLWLVVGFSPAAAQIPEDIDRLVHHRGHALLIGVSDYMTGWDQLPSVKDDLDDLKEGLRPYFETVDTVQSPTVVELRNRMHDFLMGRWNKPDERLFVYYSGHGFTDFNQSSREKDGYITGSDTPLYNETDGRAIENAVPFTDVIAWNMQTRARHVLMVFDACFSGSLFQTKGTETEPNKYEFDGIRRMLGQPIRYFITAGRQNEEVSADSTFAKLLLRGLRGGADFSQQGIISADQLGIYLSREVPRNSQRTQTPQFNSIGNVNLSEGQFFFMTGPAAPKGEHRVIAYADGAQYDGEFRDGKKNGHGVFTSATGDRYDGEFRDGKYNGRFVVTYADGDRYDGEFRDSKKNGHGVNTFATGNRYDGEFRDGKRNGRGVFTFANGNRYDGEWRDDNRNGHGVYTWPDGRRDEGEWRDDKLTGKLP